jgi:diguanylate cyclase (GGDEF)-like protein
VAQKVLLIDDCPSIHGLVRARLREEPVELHSAFDGESGLAAAATLAPDLVLLDVEMPGTNGFEVCRRMKDDPRTIHIPVIFLTGASSTQEKIRGLELGAIDYVTKPFDPAELRARVRASLRTKYLMDLLSRKAMIDGLTGLFNRAYFDARLVAELSLARRSLAPLSCIMLDVDRFKQINDLHGHPFGDEVLRGIGQVLAEHCRTEDTVCRYGGEEFIVLCPNTGSSAAASLAERLRDGIEQSAWTKNGMPVQITCSFGVSDLHGITPPSVVDLADQALYRAKQTGRNRVVIADIEPPLPTPAPIAQVA